MKTVGFLTALALATAPAMTAAADPKEMSQNPRAGLLAEINFPESQLRLPDASGSQLGRVAAWADENFDGFVVLDGHADSSGPKAKNIKLALQRARLVRDQLLALGVDPDQILISAFGPETHRARARVAIWGTHNTKEQVVASRRRANAVFDTNEAARPNPTLSGRR